MVVVVVVVAGVVVVVLVVVVARWLAFGAGPSLPPSCPGDTDGLVAVVVVEVVVVAPVSVVTAYQNSAINGGPITLPLSRSPKTTPCCNQVVLQDTCTSGVGRSDHGTTVHVYVYVYTWTNMVVMTSPWAAMCRDKPWCQFAAIIISIMHVWTNRRFPRSVRLADGVVMFTGW